MGASTYAASLPFKSVALDGLSAIYHGASGATHVVAEPVPQILEALGGDTLTLAELLARLGADYDLDDDAEAGLSARLDELVALGLVIAR
ncbi:MAG: HPr-rel-A system PqqD family peptide chaperone [Pseudomonadota bacterium]